MKSTQNFLSFALEKRKQENSFRTLSVNDSLIDFCSNDYLGFARSTELREKIDRELSRIKNQESRINGSTGSRLLRGNTIFAEDIENFIAEFHRAEAGLIYNSGYDANIGLFSSVPQKGDTIIYDDLVHASIRDGIRLSFANNFSFKHNDTDHLEQKIKAAKGTIYIAVESVYSMDGDFSPLKEIVELCKKYDCNLIVDEAHATGIFGKRGEGRVVELGLEQKIFARIHTFGKALGCHGGVVLGSKILRDFLINFSRSFIYTTALPLHSLISIKSAYDILSNETNIILKINKLINSFKIKIEVIKNIQIIESNSPIQCIILGGNDKTKSVAKKIQKEGYDVRPILSPTVPKGKERLRICLHTFNTEKEIVGLVKTLKNSL